MSCYVHLNIMIKALQQFCETPQYIDANILVRQNWHNLIEFENASPNNNQKWGSFDNLKKLNTFDEFIEIVNKYITSKLVDFF